MFEVEPLVNDTRDQERLLRVPTSARPPIAGVPVRGRAEHVPDPIQEDGLVVLFVAFVARGVPLPLEGRVAPCSFATALRLQVHGLDPPNRRPRARVRIVQHLPRPRSRGLISSSVTRPPRHE